MKKIVLLFAAAFAFGVYANAQFVPNIDSIVKVSPAKHDFGKIKQSVPVTYNFEIKNLSNKPLVVENTWASCGCTTPDKITEPIAPGATVKLKVQYNAAAGGPFTKDVYIKLAGIDANKTVQITGEVLAADAYETWQKKEDSLKATMPTKTNTKNSKSKS